ncbi:uncharacterized protein MKK02DRAFT_43652 [Dioszegia hungarica]|uniref:BTB domain-containing protein n=1 Tax=Dioszegia hungarica TaxID=4972 RepID=A0AA38LV02_9TREE|nr:uncharacterized protein MKK02DRAFT_43652 [Dioszegia hungarica]KAI9637722.1 hypothetical protein MKK02DRAFT_43652 [Dioszegia hungarica]
MPAASPARTRSSARISRTPENPELIFHEDFQAHHPGDIILQAGDSEALCYRFSRSLLVAISPFFANLPVAGPDDLHQGVPLIPLHDTTTAGLHVFLTAVKAITTSETFPRIEYGEDHVVPYLEAALIGRVYDAPAIYRILIENLQDPETLTSRDYYLEFAIWAIGGITAKLPKAAANTLLADADDNTDVDGDIVDVCESHGPQRFRERVDPISSLQKPFSAHEADPSLARCKDVKKDAKDIAAQVRARIAEAKTTTELLALKKRRYDVACRACRREAEDRYRPHMRWLADYTEYIRGSR